LANPRFVATVDFPGVLGEGNRTTGKEKLMSNNHENRVLTRRGARQLTSDELQQINGGDGPFTRASLTGTNTMHSPDTDMDS
jgi:bacteriocin-like protein